MITIPERKDASINPLVFSHETSIWRHIYLLVICLYSFVDIGSIEASAACALVELPATHFIVHDFLGTSCALSFLNLT